MKQTFLSGATLAALVMLVALPLVFILLQAIFPHFSAGSLGDAFGGIPALLADPQLPAMLGGTLWIAGGVALVSVMIGLPLGILRGMFSLPLPRLESPAAPPGAATTKPPRNSGPPGCNTKRRSATS